MEPSQKQMRIVWPLFKCVVSKRTEMGCELVIAMGGISTTIHIAQDMRLYDVREGDLLTVYTEVLLAKGEGHA